MESWETRFVRGFRPIDRQENFLERLLAALFVIVAPGLVMHWLGIPIAAIWLIANREWSLLGLSFIVAVAVMFLAPFIVALLMWPSYVAALAAAGALKRRWTWLAVPCMWFSYTWTILLIIATCVGVIAALMPLLYSLSGVRWPSSSMEVVVFYLLSWGVAIAPWVQVAREPDVSELESILISGVALGYLIYTWYAATGSSLALVLLGVWVVFQFLFVPGVLIGIDLVNVRKEVALASLFSGTASGREDS